ncbi:DUF3078 domain-containing protein [Williamwhitmania taraxaci]|nr:DUF3078 domain-containing protein [Williamwhitmania taraxaci]
MKHNLPNKRKTALAFLLFFLITVTSVKSQETADTTKKVPEKPWKITNALSITFSQVALSNWVAGGEKSISGNGSYIFGSKFKDENNSWESTFDLAYGQTRQGDSKNIKNDDRILLSTKYGRKASSKWNYSILASFRTQMLPGYNYPNDSTIISDWMAPGYFGLSIGMDYKPTSQISVFLSPLSGKLTVVKRQDLADKGSFGVDKATFDGMGNKIKDGKNTLWEAGGLTQITGTFPFNKGKTILTSKLELFSNYLKDPQNIDLIFENTLEVKINSWFTARLFALAIYDDNSKIGTDTDGDGTADKYTAKLQLKEIFGLGIGVKW